MRVFKRGNGLAVRIPKALVRALDLKAGDEISMRVIGKRNIEISRSEVASEKDREQAMERIRAMAVSLPPDWKFDRDEINSR